MSHRDFKSAVNKFLKDSFDRTEEMDIYPVGMECAQFAYDWCDKYMVTDRHVKRLKELGEKITECTLQKRAINMLKKKLAAYCSCSVSISKCDVCTTIDEAEKTGKV